MTQQTKMYDISPESWFLGAVDKLSLMSIALSCYDTKQNSFLAQVATFVTIIACFSQKKLRVLKISGFENSNITTI